MDNLTLHKAVGGYYVATILGAQCPFDDVQLASSGLALWLLKRLPSGDLIHTLMIRNELVSEFINEYRQLSGICLTCDDGLCTARCLSSDVPKATNRVSSTQAAGASN